MTDWAAQVAQDGTDPRRSRLAFPEAQTTGTFSVATSAVSHGAQLWAAEAVLRMHDEPRPWAFFPENRGCRTCTPDGCPLLTWAEAVALLDRAVELAVPVSPVAPWG